MLDSGLGGGDSFFAPGFFLTMDVGRSKVLLMKKPEKILEQLFINRYLDFEKWRDG